MAMGEPGIKTSAFWNRNPKPKLNTEKIELDIEERFWIRRLMFSRLRQAKGPRSRPRWESLTKKMMTIVNSDVCEVTLKEMKHGTK